MGEYNDKQLTPYRLQILMDVAARVAKLMVTGVWHLTYEEMELVLDNVRHNVELAKLKNKEGDQKTCS